MNLFQNQRREDMRSSAKSRSLGVASFQQSNQQMQILAQHQQINNSNDAITGETDQPSKTPSISSVVSQISGFIHTLSQDRSTDKLLTDAIMGTSFENMHISKESIKVPLEMQRQDASMNLSISNESFRVQPEIQRQYATMNLNVDPNDQASAAPIRRVLKGTSKDWFCSNGTLDFSMASLDWFSQGTLPAAKSLRIAQSEENMECSAIGSYPNFDHENASLESSNELTPTEHDILCGRGTSTNKHPGNISYRKMIERCKPIYRELLTKDDKRDYSKLVKEHIEQCGGRFLKKCLILGTWVKMDDNDARKKVSQSLRESKKKKKGSSTCTAEKSGSE
jgi:hypothetical protein